MLKATSVKKYDSLQQIITEISLYLPFRFPTLLLVTSPHPYSGVSTEAFTRTFDPILNPE